MFTPKGTVPATTTPARSARLAAGAVGGANQVVPPTVPGRTIAVHACLEGSVRLLPVSDEVNHGVYHAASTPPEG